MESRLIQHIKNEIKTYEQEAEDILISIEENKKKINDYIFKINTLKDFYGANFIEDEEVETYIEAMDKLTDRNVKFNLMLEIVIKKIVDKNCNLNWINREWD